MLKYVDPLTRIDTGTKYVVLKSFTSGYGSDYEPVKECVYESEKIFSNDKRWKKYSFDKNVFACYVPHLKEEVLYNFVQTCLKIVGEKTEEAYKGDITEIYFYDNKNKEPKYVIVYHVDCGSMTLYAKDLRKNNEEELLLI